jgi:hypothetical protein
MRHDSNFRASVTKRGSARNGLSAWQRYELEKLSWLQANPEATAIQYQKAMNEIVKRIGV